VAVGEGEEKRKIKGNSCDGKGNGQSGKHWGNITEKRNPAGKN